jgi:uncharacterized membrane protein YesL
MTTLVPGLPSFGLIPVTTGGGFAGIFSSFDTTLHISKEKYTVFRTKQWKFNTYFSFFRAPEILLIANLLLVTSSPKKISRARAVVSIHR